MFYLLYVSVAANPMSEQGLLDLLALSREKNQRLGITGMLLYKDDKFMQMLEGDERTVRELFDTIKNDPRHIGVVTVMSGHVDGRNFADWSMGFVNMDDVESLPGFEAYLQESLISRHFTEDAENAYNFILFFNKLLA